MNFEEKYDDYKQKFETYFLGYFQKLSDSIYENNFSQFQHIQNLQAFSKENVHFNKTNLHLESSQKLLQSLKYSCFTKGKRFRPVLVMSTVQSLGGESSATLPYCAAIEMIHTYSLIHDDLPCMDNDDLRRGLPTNHKVFGEAPALLAGDALLTLAFEVLATEIKDPTLSQKLSRVLSQKAGFWGMISGQMTDLSSAQVDVPLETLLLVHRNKTSALIEACILGAGIIQNMQNLAELKKLGILMGLSFQIADDIMDFEAKKEKNNFVHIVGLSESQKILEKLTQECFLQLSSMERSEFLEKLVLFNTQRKV